MDLKLTCDRIKYIKGKVVINMKLYHGSDVTIEKPSTKKGRTDVDFGLGFYLTADRNMAQKWACNKSISIINEYDAVLENLNIKELKADEEWLDYVIYNRTHEVDQPFDDTVYDVIIGPTADDKLFATIDLYSDGIISKEKAIEIVNCMNYSLQYVFKNENAIEKGLSFCSSKELMGLEKQKLFEQMINDRKMGSRKANDIMRKGVR